MVPVEVKSGTNAHLKSLQLFERESECKVAVRFWSKPYSENVIALDNGVTYKLLNLPYYYAGNMERALQNAV